jgi:hypothetical protein
VSLRRRLRRLEQKIDPPEQVILVLSSDAERARLGRIRPGSGVFVLAHPQDRPLVEGAAARGVRVAAQYIGGIDLSTGI